MSNSHFPPSTESLPHSFRSAVARGLRGRCPRCGDGGLFRKWLKPRDACPACALDLRPQRADDFPAYIAIFVTGHLLAPVIIMLASDFALTTIQMALVVFPLALLSLFATLQPAKGAVIAAQWWNGMHGFRRERADEVASP